MIFAIIAALVTAVVLIATGHHALGIILLALIVGAATIYYLNRRK